MTHDIYLLQLGLHPVAVVGRLVQKWEIGSTKGEIIYNTIKNTE
jgi:hypothetical protein